MADPYERGPAAYLLMQMGGEPASFQMARARDKRKQDDPAWLAALIEGDEQHRLFRFQAKRAKLPCIGPELAEAAEGPENRVTVTLSFGWASTL